MAITAKKIAKMLGISEAAVSLALNNKPGVSSDTREKIIHMAEVHGYDFSKTSYLDMQAEQAAICLVVYRKKGCIVKETSFFSGLIEGIQDGCKKMNYKLNTMYLCEEKEVEECVKTQSELDIKGFIVIATEMDSWDLEVFEKSQRPFVLLDNYFENAETNCVVINNYSGAFTAVDYLIKKRETLPGYLHSSCVINNFRDREMGFYKAVQSNGMSKTPPIIHIVHPSLEGAYEDVKRYIKEGHSLADCYFADNDLIAVGAMRAFKEAGYEIPKDIAIVGFDDIPLCIYVEPMLSSMHVPKEYMGKQSVYRLHDMIKGYNKQSVRIEIIPELIERKSS